MEGVGGGDRGLVASALVDRWCREVGRLYQYYLDKSAPHTMYRWIGTFVIAVLYAFRVYSIRGFHVVTYVLWMFLLFVLIEFLTPLVDPEQEPSDGPLLPTKGSDEFKPFLRRLPEFKCWHCITVAFCIAFVMTFFAIFDVPVFWPMLLLYWMFLFARSMKRQIAHMIKYKYIPFSIGKQKYGGKNSAASSCGSRD